MKSNEQPLLSICIPTYNRCTILDKSMQIIKKQFDLLKNKDNIEIIVSDNHSQDNTPEIVNRLIKQNLPIRYIRNRTNIGPDRNFVQCFTQAKGKYLWLLGDDDFIKEGALEKIINILSSGTYGIVHLQMFANEKQDSYTIYDDIQKFATDINIWFTFISANIVNTAYVTTVDIESYLDSYLIQTPLYITAALSERKNVLIHEKLLEDGILNSTNGGYNLFEVFVSNYLRIWRGFLKNKKLKRSSYEKIKYYLLKDFLIIYIYRLLIKKDIGNFKVDLAWKILLTTYGVYPYFYSCFVIFGIKEIINKKIK